MSKRARPCYDDAVVDAAVKRARLAALRERVAEAAMAWWRTPGSYDQGLTDPELGVACAALDAAEKEQA